MTTRTQDHRDEPTGSPDPGEWEAQRRDLYDEAVRGATAQARRREASVEAPVAGAPSPPSRERVVAGGLVLVALIAVLAVQSVPELARSTLGSPAPYAAGAVGEDRSKALDRVLLELWRVRSSMDRYVRDHDGLPPRALTDLEDVAPVCPASGRPWVYETDARRYRVSCPEPGALDRGSVFLDWRVGPPQVSLRPIGGFK